MKAALLDGIALGLQYGLLGVGMTLVYGLASILNLAFGEIAVLGAIVTALAHDAGVPLVLAIMLGLAVAGVAMLVLDKTVLRVVYRKHGEQRILMGLLVMLGIAFIIEGLLTWRYPSKNLAVRIGGDPISVFGVKMTTGTLLASAIAIAVGLVLLVFFRFTTLGRGVRSVIQDEIGAQLSGVNPVAVRTFVLVLSGLLATLVAVTRSMTGPIGPANATMFTTLALIVAVVGGLGSVQGAFAAGVLLGVVDRLSSYYIGSYVTTIVLLAFAAVTILVRPAGLFRGTS